MFKLILTNGVDELEISFKVRDTDIAKKWLSELSKEYEIYETDRFSNWGKTTLIDDLNKCIDIINEHEFIIDKKVSTKTTQKDLNYLHKIFEDKRGELTNPSQWFMMSPESVQKSLERYNILIHELESEIRNKGRHPTLVVTFKDRPRYELTDADCRYFTFKWTSGTVYINYCQTGKTILDVFKDRDDIAKGIRPQTHYSADFMIKFGPSTNLIYYCLRSIILKGWMRYKGLKFRNPNLGMIPVADILSPIDQKLLLKYNKVKSICII